MYSPSSGPFRNSPGNHPQQMFHPRSNSSPMMYSPRNNSSNYYPRNNGPPNMYSPRNNPPQDFHSPRNNTSQMMYSPNSTFQGMYSPMNSPQDAYSPRNTSHEMYIHRNSMPMRQQLFRKSFNRSNNSSDFNSSNQSFSSNDGFSPRGKPYERRNKKGGHSERPYNIQDYINPSMLQDPWADFKTAKVSKPSVGGQS